MFDPKDHIDHHRAMKAVHNVSAGRIVCELKPGPRTTAVYAEAVLDAVGKELDLRGNSKSAELNWKRSALWLRAETVKELIVLRAHHLDFRGYARMVGLAAQAGCGLTLVHSGCAGLDRRRERAVADFPFERLCITRWLERCTADWSPQPLRGPACSADPVFPPVPEDDFTLFRASARRLLPPSEFAVVDATWLRAHRDTLRWMSVAESVDEDTVADFLRGQMRSAGSYGAVLTLLRGAQAALFRKGWHVKVDDEMFAASAVQEPYDLLTQGTANLLRGFVPPRYAAAATLALVTREPTEVLVNFNVSDVAADGASVRLRRESLPVPTAFHPFMRAQRFELQSAGAAEDWPFFVSERYRRSQRVVRMTATALSATLKRVTRETGVLVTRDFTRRKVHANAVSWTQRRGVSVVPILSEKAQRYRDRAA